MVFAPVFHDCDVFLMQKNIYEGPPVLITEPAVIQAEKLSDCAGGIARYWSHVILPISMVSCAFATTGTIEIANVRPINLHLIEVVLDAGSTRFLKTAAGFVRKP